MAAATCTSKLSKLKHVHVCVPHVIVFQSNLSIPSNKTGIYKNSILADCYFPSQFKLLS